jgi:tRNA A-37 threonylcarbamoyl transferase component Bud32
VNLNNVIATRKNKTVFRDGNLAIKLFDNEYSKSDVLNEALNQSRVEETGLPIPKLHEVTKINGKWAIISDFINGKTMSAILKENPENENECIGRLVDIQIEIQSKKAPMLNKLKDKMERKICGTAFNATIRYELHMRLNSKPTHYKICHGDLCPSNIIITPENELYVIDWSHVTQGNASADAARTYLLFCLQGETERAKKYLNLFSEKSDTAKQYINEWLPIVAASQSVKAIPEETEFLKRWIDVVEYE